MSKYSDEFVTPHASCVTDRRQPSDGTSAIWFKRYICWWSSSKDMRGQHSSYLHAPNLPRTFQARKQLRKPLLGKHRYFAWLNIDRWSAMITYHRDVAQLNLISAGYSTARSIARHHIYEILVKLGPSATVRISCTTWHTHRSDSQL